MLTHNIWDIKNIKAWTERMVSYGMGRDNVT